MKIYALALMALISACATRGAMADEITIVVHPGSGAPDKTYKAAALGMVPMTVERAMQSAGMKYTATWFPNTPGYAAMIIEGMPPTTTGNFGTSYWMVCVDGYGAAAGLQTLVRAGNQVEWSLVTGGKCPKDP